jgi:hypothetical protein
MNFAAIQSVATVCIATFVAVIGFLQWRISREKLRLDLFNRRFDIYLRVLNYHLALSRSQNSPEQLEELEPFIKAIRESRFMFPTKSGVRKFLEDFQARANEVVNFTASQKMLEDMPEERAKLSSRQLENTAWLYKAVITLEGMMEPYVKFNRL